MSQITVSATHARINFGEIMRQAQATPVVVERGGEPLVVILSKQEYDHITGAQGEDWRELLAETHRKLKAHLQGRELPDPVEIIREGREIRDAQIQATLP